MRRSLLTLVAMAVGLLAVLTSGLNGLFWTATDNSWQVILRLLLLTAGLAIVAVAAIRWGEIHSGTLAKTPRRTGEPRFAAYSISDLRITLQQAYAAQPQLNATELISLAKMIVAEP